MGIIKRFCKEIGLVIISLSVIALLCAGIYSIMHESYKVGQASKERIVNTQVIAILDLQKSNEDLQTNIIYLNGDNSTLRILTQTQQKEIDNLKTTISNLNTSITNLQNEKTATDEVVANLNKDIAYLNNYVSQLENELNSLNNTIVISLPVEWKNCTNICSYKVNDDKIILSDSSSYNAVKGLWEYTISTKQFIKVVDSSYSNYKYIFEFDNKLLISSSYTSADEIVLDLDTLEYSLPLLQNYTGDTHYLFRGVLKIIQVPNYDIVLCLGESNTYVYKNDIFYMTSIQCSYNQFYNIKPIDENEFLLHSRYGLYSLNLLDLSSTNLVSYNNSYDYGDYLLGVTQNTNILFIYDYANNEKLELDVDYGQSYLPSKKYFINNRFMFVANNIFYDYDISTKTLTSIKENCSSLYTYIFENRFFITFSEKVLYEYNFDTKSFDVLDDTHGGSAFGILPTTTGYIYTLNNVGNSLFYLDYTSGEVKTIGSSSALGTGVISGYFQNYIKINDDFYYLVGENFYDLIINNDATSIYSTVSGSGGSYTSSKFYETETHMFIQNNRGIVVVPKNDPTSYVQYYCQKDMEIYKTLENGDMILKSKDYFTGIYYYFNLTDLTISAYEYEV